MLTLFPGLERSVRRFEPLDTDRYGEVFRGLLARGIYLAPSQYECLFPSLAHGEAEIEATAAALAELGA
jgi:glutamate-1-semialdehyde 2,1-aminomutase